jgi:hypothetical protein
MLRYNFFLYLSQKLKLIRVCEFHHLIRIPNILPQVSAQTPSQQVRLNT